MLYTGLVCCSFLVISFISSALSLSTSKCSFLVGLYLFLSSLYFHIFPFSILLFTPVLYLLLFFYSYTFWLCLVFKSVLGNDVGKSTEDYSLKFVTNVILCEEQYVTPNIMSSAPVSSTGLTDPDEFQRRLHVFHLNHRSRSDLIVVKGVIICTDSFAVPDPYKFERLSMDAVLESL